MGKHYLPQVYLRGFEKDERLWAYDRVEGRSFRSQAKSVANETDMYSDELEGVLAARIEDPAKLAIDKARARQSIDEDDRRALATYAVCLWKRVPDARVRVAAALPEVGENVRNELHHQLETELAAKPHLAEVAARRRAEIDLYVERYVNERADEIWQLTLREGQSAAVIDAMLSMDWRFLISTDEQFLTCDNPVYFHRHEGIGKRLGTLMGVVMVAHQLGGFAGAWLGGWAVEHSGTYQGLWLADIGLALLAAALQWPLRRKAVPRERCSRAPAPSATKANRTHPAGYM